MYVYNYWISGLTIPGQVGKNLYTRGKLFYNIFV